MRGKIVNLCIALMNILYGALIIAYTKFVPQDSTLMTVQENFVVGYVLTAIYMVMLSIAIIDLIQSYNHRSDTVFNTGYVLGIFALSFIFIKQPAIGAFNILSGLIVLYKTLKENLVELNSTTGISISIVVMSAICIIGGVALNYDNIGISIKNKENKNELAFKEDFFKYVTVLEKDSEIYGDSFINIKKDGKYGYIRPNGEVVIDFLYDYASPFIEITEYGKKFYVALVCKDGSTYVILKNGRKVLSYRTESADDNYAAKQEELINVYKNILKQTDEIKYEVPKITDNINKIYVYEDIQTDYTYLYDYSEEYDLGVSKSNLGLGDSYELIRKDDPNYRIKFDTNSLDYNEKYLSVFSNGTIPFYEISKRTQGWFTDHGKKNSMSGKAQILDYFDDKLLLRNYNDNTVYFTDVNGNMISEKYKDIYVCKDQGRYIVRDLDTFCRLIDTDFNSVFASKHVVINPRLIADNIYLILDSTENIKFNDYGYAIMNWKLMNFDGDIILENVEQVYDEFYEFPNENKEKELNYMQFENNLKSFDYNFAGDKFYEDY